MQTIPLSTLIECRDMLRKAAASDPTFSRAFSVMAGALSYYIEEASKGVNVLIKPAEVQHAD